MLDLPVIELDLPVIEQVIAVPTQRSALPVPQTAELLVEVPTNPGYALAVVASKLFSRREIRGILSGRGVPQGRGGSGARGGLQGSCAGQNSTAYLEQIVEIPVPQGRRGSGGGLQGSLPVQNSAAIPEQIVDIPVPQGRRRSSGSPQGSLPGRGSTAFVEQIVEIPAPGGLQGFLPDQGSSSRRLLPEEDDGFQAVFRTFPQPKKSAKVTRQSSPRVPASASSSELSAHQMAPAGESGELADEPGGMDLQRWRRGLSGRDGRG